MGSPVDWVDAARQQMGAKLAYDVAEKRAVETDFRLISLSSTPWWYFGARHARGPSGYWLLIGGADV